MNARDYDYIEGRLLTPATDLLDARQRLDACGEHEAANRLMRAVQALTDECRAIRHELGRRP
jgi:hypothetical protein